MKITFSQDCQLESEGPGQGPSYKAGETHELRDDVAERWIHRGVATATNGNVGPAMIQPGATTEPGPKATLKASETNGNGAADDKGKPDDKPEPAEKPADPPGVPGPAQQARTASQQPRR